VDLSFLNLPEKPAGKHGFLNAGEGSLVFEDGTRARFWGTNLTANALFGMGSREDVRLQARRLSQLGFNLVRLHHHDSYWVNPNIFGQGDTADTKKLNGAMLQRMDWWIKCLKDEGIYLWLDLEVQRQLTQGDGIAGFDEISKSDPSDNLRGYNYVNSSIQQAMKLFNESYLNHLNTFTGLRYKDDPAIVSMMLSNENDITFHFANRLLPDKHVPNHDAAYMAEANAFAGRFQLPKDKVWRSWEPGPSKLFLNDLERRFDVDMLAHLRALGVKVPVVTTSSWGGPLYSLPALTSGDIIDVHSYGRAGELERNPLKIANMVHWIAASRVVGRPLSVSEWNVEPFPVPDRDVIPLYLAASARLQGWDIVMQYAYAQEPIVGWGRPSNWQSFNDPALMATLPAAALLYRRGDVREADTVYVFAPTQAQLFGEDISPDNAVALRTATEKGKLMIALPGAKELSWLERSVVPAGAKVVSDPSRSLIDNNANDAVSDTGELRHDWDQGVFTIDTPRTQAAMGRIGGKSVNLTDVEIAVTTPSATVAVQSLDDKQIRNADRILISLGATSVPKGRNELPFYSEPIVGHLRIQARKGLKLYAQRGTSTDKSGTDLRYENGRYQITLDASIGTYWLLLK
jgi:hypothetical protein